MFDSVELRNVVAKQLAMLANDQVSVLATAVFGDVDRPAAINGAVIGLLPHLMEKAIVTSTFLSTEVAADLSIRFLREFESLVKIVANAGGFSNSLTKAAFNVGFHTMFQREYDELRPHVEGICNLAREHQSSPLPYFAYMMLKRCEGSSGLALDSEKRLAAVGTAVETLFEQVHSLLQRA